MKAIILFLFLNGLALIGNSQQIKISICLIEKGVLKTVEAEYNSVSGDTTVVINGLRKAFEEVYPGVSSEYAGAAKWYINNGAIIYKGKRFVKYGLPRILGMTEVIKSDTYNGVGVYVEAGYGGEIEVVYIPVRSGCEFQPYQKEIPPCGKITITPSLKTIKQGQNVVFTANYTGTKGKLIYYWYADGGTVVGSETGKTFTVSTKNFSGKLTVEVEVRVENSSCASVYKDLTVEVKK